MRKIIANNTECILRAMATNNAIAGRFKQNENHEHNEHNEL